MCLVEGSEVHHAMTTNKEMAGPMGIAVKDTWVDMIHKEVPPTAPVAVVVEQVVRAVEMLVVAVVAATIVLEKMGSLPIAAARPELHRRYRLTKIRAVFQMVY